MILRMLVMGTRSPGQAAGDGEAAAREGADGAVDWDTGADGALGDAGGRSMKAMMSCLVIRPPSPVPETCERFTLCSRAILRTSGEERASSSPSSAGSCAGGGGALAAGAGTEAGADLFSSFFSGTALTGADFSGAVAGGAADFAAVAASPSTAIVPTMVFTPTVVPSETLISCRTPEAGAGISASTLSVEISKSGSSRWALSPRFFYHFVIIPSTLESPIWGMMMSVGMISFHTAMVRDTGPDANGYYSGCKEVGWQR